VQSTKLEAEFLEKVSDYKPNYIYKTITVEIVDKCIRMLKPNKAVGFDGIAAEHLSYAHPRLVVLLALFFNALVKHGSVPTGFGIGVIVPLLKSNTLSGTLSDHYRGITVSSVISKVFEMCLYECYNDFFGTSDLQFGFKKGLGCSHALFAMNTVVDYFCQRGSTVNV